MAINIAFETDSIHWYGDMVRTTHLPASEPIVDIHWLEHIGTYVVCGV
jgi:hypothetical protein